MADERPPSARALTGAVDILSPRRIAGWVWSAADPSERLRIVVRRGDVTLFEVEASKLRPDLRGVGIGDGRYAYDIDLDEPLAESSLADVVVEVKDAGYRLPLTPAATVQSEEAAPPLRDCQVNVYNFATLMAEDPSVFGTLRVDPNNDCNLHCVYCHNERSPEVLETEALRTFFHTKVLGLYYFVMGCGMEPTLDKRLADLMLLVADSPAKPRYDFLLQTNGILLHRHDHQKMKAAGLTSLSVSVDAAEPATQKLLRNGTSLDKVVRNVVAFHEACPDVAIEFITTVTSANVDKTEALVRLGLDIGVKRFVFREVFYHPHSLVVDHARMPGLLLRGSQFVDMKQRLLDTFGSGVDVVFADNERLDELATKMHGDSRM